MIVRRRWRFQIRVFVSAFAAAAPAWLIASFALWRWDANVSLRWTLFALMSIALAAGAAALVQRVVDPLRSLANLLEALREGDYSMRGRRNDPADAVGEVMIELNQLSQLLYDARIDDVEAGVLLGKVIAEIDMAVFAFDSGRRLRLVNRAGEALLGEHAHMLVGRHAADLGLDSLLGGRSGRIVTQGFPGGGGRWDVRHRRFREGGRPHELLVISDLSHALRDEERQAWRRLVRVIGHELNSSLTPIKSMAGTLQRLVGREPLPEDWRADTDAGLAIIHDRAESLARFMSAYARLARLPAPVRHPFDFGPLVGRVVSLFADKVDVEPGPSVRIEADADQIEQVLINLIKNAVEAVDGQGSVIVSWRRGSDALEATIVDDGPGLSRTDNLWVPFFTTKPGGTGIGLALSREIIENHGGTVTLANRTDGAGCVARVCLPFDVSA